MGKKNFIEGQTVPRGARAQMGWPVRSFKPPHITFARQFKGRTQLVGPAGRPSSGIARRPQPPGRGVGGVKRGPRGSTLSCEQMGEGARAWAGNVFRALRVGFGGTKKAKFSFSLFHADCFGDVHNTGGKVGGGGFPAEESPKRERSPPKKRNSGRGPPGRRWEVYGEVLKTQPAIRFTFNPGYSKGGQFRKVCSRGGAA